MDRAFNLRKTKNNLNGTAISSRPATKANFFDSNPIDSKQISKNGLKTKNSFKFDSNITNFYQLKKRTHSNNDSFDDSPVKLSPFKKRKSSDLKDDDHLPITWGDKINVSVDCQLKVNFETNQQRDTSLSFKRNETKLDQMLNEFHAKLQFEVLSKEENNKKKRKDEGERDKNLIKKDQSKNKDKIINEDKLKNNDGVNKPSNKEDSGNELDDMFDEDDSWLIKDNVLNELEKQLIENKMTTSKNQSKESGISSCNSLELNKQNSQSNEPLLKNSLGKNNAKLFKMPETPTKGSIKFNSTISSNQFVSTPKVISRNSSKLNQCLFFENLSPIRGNDNDSLVNIKSDSKRALNDSLHQENSSYKKRNGRILFRSNNKQNDKVSKQTVNKIETNKKYSGTNKHEDFGTDLFEDSFDLILSQVDDKILKNEKASLNYRPTMQIRNKQQQLKAQACESYNRNQCYNQRTRLSSTINCSKTQPAPHQTVNPKTQQFMHSSSSVQTSKSTKSSIQFEDDSSNLFAVESIQKKNNLNKNQINDHNINRNGNERSKNEKNDSNDDYFMDDDDADFICSQVIS